MFFLKSCPKCHGDIYLDRDNYGTYIECLQCGFVRDVTVKQEIEHPSSPRRLSSTRLGQPQLIGLLA